LHIDIPAVYHYAADVGTTVFNGRVQLGVEQEITATLPPMSYRGSFSVEPTR